MLIFVRRTVAVLAAASIVLTACGTAEEAGPNTDGVTAPPAAASDEPALAPTEGATGEELAEAPVVSDATTAQVDDVPATTDPAAPVIPEAVIGGRALSSELAAQSDFSENVLPNIQVDDVRRGTKVSLRNVFPAERPVLLWMWAPH